MATPRSETYSAPSGASVHGGRFGLPAWLAEAAVNEWVEVPNGQPSLAAGLVPAVAGNMGARPGIVNAWCGAFVDQGRFCIHGGGHADYGGNEIGAIDLTVESPAWDLLVERSPVGALLGGSNYYADGLPTSRHTYYAMAVATVGGVRRFLRFNGWMGFAYNGPPVGGAADVRTTAVDGFRFDTGVWEPAAFGPVTAITGSETSFAQDPVTGDCFIWHAGDGTIQRYVVATDTCSRVADLSGVDGGGAATVFDAVAQRLVRFAGRGSHRLSYWTVGSGSRTTPSFTGPAASSLNALSGSNHGCGVAHDTLRNVAYLLDNAATLYRVRLSDFYAEQVTTSGVTAAAPTNNTWGRLKYIAELDAIAYLANWTAPLIAMRCGD